MSKAFLKELLVTLNEFHDYQLKYEEDDLTPYPYDTLGLAEWLTFNKGIDLTNTTEEG